MNTQKIPRIILLALVLISIFSCKNEDEISIPVIEVLSPLPYEHYDAGDSILIHAKISDVSTLQSLQVKLTDSELLPVLPSLAFQANSKQFELNSNYYLNPSELQTNSYYLLVRAENKNQFKNEYIPLNIEAASTQEEGLIIISENENSKISIWKTDNNFDVELVDSFEGDYTDSEFDGEAGQLYISGFNEFNLKSIDILSGNLSWSIENPPLPGIPVHLTNCMSYNENLYVTFYNQYVFGYNELGETVFDASVPENDSPTSIVVTENFVVVEIRKKNNGTPYISVRNKLTGAEKQNVLINFSVLQFMSENSGNTIWIGANNSVGSSLHKYDIDQNLLQQKAAWDEPMLCAIQISSSEIVVGLSSGWHLYKTLTNSSSLLLSDPDPVKVAYDANVGLILANGNEITVYSFPEMVNQKTLPFSDTILNIHLQFNN